MSLLNEVGIKPPTVSLRSQFTGTLNKNQNKTKQNKAPESEALPLGHRAPLNSIWCDTDHIIMRPKKNEPRHEKTNILHMRKQRRRSASR